MSTASMAITDEPIVDEQFPVTELAATESTTADLGDFMTTTEQLTTEAIIPILTEEVIFVPMTTDSLLFATEIPIDSDHQTTPYELSLNNSAVTTPAVSYNEVTSEIIDVNLVQESTTPYVVEIDKAVSPALCDLNVCQNGGTCVADATEYKASINPESVNLSITNTQIISLI